VLSVPGSKVNDIHRNLVAPTVMPELGKLIVAPFKAANVLKLPVTLVGLVVHVDSLSIFADVIFNLPAKSGELVTASTEPNLTLAISIDPPLCIEINPDVVAPGAKVSPKEAVTLAAGVASLLSSSCSVSVPVANTFPVLVALLVKKAKVAPLINESADKIESPLKKIFLLNIIFHLLLETVFEFVRITVS